MSSIRRSVRPLAACLLTLAGAAAAIAQPDLPPPPLDDAFLGGPEVMDQGVPGAPGDFGGQAEGKEERDRIPFRLFLGVFRSLGSERTPENLRLSDQQQDVLKKLARSHADEVKAYLDGHRQELDELREKAGPPPHRRRRAGAPAEPGVEPPLEPGAMPDGARAQAGGLEQPAMPKQPRSRRAEPLQLSPEAAAVRERLREIIKGAPKPDAVQSLMWAVLTEDQRALAHERLDAAMAKRREMGAAMREQGQQGALGKGPRQRIERFQQLSPEEQDQIRARMKQRFDALPAEQQERLKQRMERLKQRRAERGLPLEPGVDLPPPPPMEGDDLFAPDDAPARP